jgi:hypothetical protein
MQIRIIIPNNVALYPLCCNGEWITPIQAYGQAIADIAGGFTSWQGIGGWKDSHGVLVVEPITIVEVNTETRKVDIPIDLRLLAQRIARELSQECVYLAIDGKAEYITP